MSVLLRNSCQEFCVTGLLSGSFRTLSVTQSSFLAGLRFIVQRGPVLGSERPCAKPLLTGFAAKSSKATTIRPTCTTIGGLPFWTWLTKYRLQSIAYKVLTSWKSWNIVRALP